jgi:Holliday junction resolvase
VTVNDGVYQIADPALRLWLMRRSDAGMALPPLVLGNEAEKEVARRMAAAGFELVYQSRASRGAFDLLAILETTEVGVQVKKAELPFYLSREELERMRYWAERLSWIPLLAIVRASGVRFYDARSLEATGRSCRLDENTEAVQSLLRL